MCHVFLQKNPGLVITKFNFNALFSKAWLESVTGANAIAGFKSCGVFPFNPNVFQMLQTSGKSSTSEPVHSTEETTADEPTAMLVDSNSIFSVDQEQETL